MRTIAGFTDAHPKAPQQLLRAAMFVRGLYHSGRRLTVGEVGNLNAFVNRGECVSGFGIDALRAIVPLTENIESAIPLGCLGVRDVSIKHVRTMKVPSDTIGFQTGSKFYYTGFWKTASTEFWTHAYNSRINQNKDTLFPYSITFAGAFVTAERPFHAPIIYRLEKDQDLVTFSREVIAQDLKQLDSGGWAVALGMAMPIGLRPITSPPKCGEEPFNPVRGSPQVTYIDALFDKPLPTIAHVHFGSLAYNATGHVHSLSLETGPNRERHYGGHNSRLVSYGDGGLKVVCYPIPLELMSRANIVKPVPGAGH